MAIRWTKGDKAGTVTHEGLVLELGHEHYVGYGRSITESVVWDPERGAPRMVTTHVSDSEYGYSEWLAEVAVDASLEVVAAYGTWKVRVEAERAEAEREREAGRLVKGKLVEVVRGRKVPVGTKGVLIWIGASRFGDRVGVKDEAGEVHWTAAGNVEVVVERDAEGHAVLPAPPEPPAPPAVTKGMAVRTPDGFTGRVFWMGLTKSGTAWRVGVKDAAGTVAWASAAEVVAA